MRGRKEKPLAPDGRAASPLGATIRAWRKHRGLSATALAVAAGFREQGRGYISKLEHGDITKPEPERVDRIAVALGVARSELENHQMPPGWDERPVAAANSAQQPSHAPLLAASGILSAPVNLHRDEQAGSELPFGEQVEAVIARLPFAERELAERLILQDAQRIAALLEAYLRGNRR